MRPIIVCLLLAACGSEDAAHLSSEADAREWPSYAFATVPNATAAETADVLVRLRSSEPRDLAWGGYLAGSLGVREAGPALLHALAVTDDVEATSNLLDGAVRTGTTIPAELLRTVSERLPGSDNVLVAALADPETHRDFLRDAWSAKAGADAARAAANALTLLRDKPFAAELLARLTARVTINVRGSHDPLMALGRGYAYGSSCRCGGYVIDSTMPPTPLWAVASASWRDSEVDAALVIALPGPRAAWIMRNERGARQVLEEALLQSRLDVMRADAGVEADPKSELDDDAASPDLDDEIPNDDPPEEPIALARCTREAATADTRSSATSAAAREHNAYLAALLGRDDDTLFEDMQTVEHVWRGPEAYDALVWDVRARFESRYQEIADALRAADLLPENTTVAPVPVAVERFDRRSCDHAEPFEAVRGL